MAGAARTMAPTGKVTIELVHVGQEGRHGFMDSIAIQLSQQ
jgi:hypothetical protein